MLYYDLIKYILNIDYNIIVIGNIHKSKCYIMI